MASDDAIRRNTVALPSATRKINQAIWSERFMVLPLDDARATVSPSSGAVSYARLRAGSGERRWGTARGPMRTE
jgi:hypothetical protein